jgi:L-aspartate oxidase
MSRHVGVVRDELSLSSAAGALGAIARTMRSAKRSAESGSGDPTDTPPRVEPSRRTWEAANILTVATAMVAAASARTESRGCHRRSDHPETLPEWLRHLDVTLDAAGTISVEDRP